MQPEPQVLADLYSAFNARNIDRCLTGMQPDVTWANGMDGGFVYGHKGVRDYWTRQWKLVNPHVEPVLFSTEGNHVTVDVHQVVRTPDGTLLLDRMVKHIFTLRDGLIQRFDIAEEK